MGPKRKLHGGISTNNEPTKVKVSRLDSKDHIIPEESYESSEDLNWELVEPSLCIENEYIADENLENRPLNITLKTKNFKPKKFISERDLLKRHLNRAEKTKNVTLHTLSITTWISHYLYVIRIVNSGAWLQYCKSFLPTNIKNCKTKIEKIVEWIKKNEKKICLIKEATNFGLSEKIINRPKTIYSIFRCLNYKVRLVTNLDLWIPENSSTKRKNSLTNMSKSLYFENESNSKPNNSRPVISSDGSETEEVDSASSKIPVILEWVEIFSEIQNKWISIHNFMVDDSSIQDTLFEQRVIYILAIDHDNRLKDLTPRYYNDWFVKCKKYRLNHNYWQDILRKFCYKNTAENRVDDEHINDQNNKMDLPKRLSDFKKHPAFVLEKQMLKFETLHPNPSPILGYFRDLPVYPRSSVHTLQSKERWFIKCGRSIIKGETPIKTVSRKTISRREKSLELYGKWQTERYNPGKVKNNKIPKNEFGNIELYKPWMLPKGTVHIFLKNVVKSARKLNIEYAPAVIGWEYGRHPHPIIDGIIVLQKDAKRLLACYRKMEEEFKNNATKKESEKALNLWKRTIKSLLIKHHIDQNYEFENREV